MPAIVPMILSSLLVGMLLFFIPKHKWRLKSSLALVMSILLFFGALKVFFDASSSWLVFFPSSYPQLLHSLGNFLVFQIDGVGSIMVLLLGIMLPILATGVITNDWNTGSYDHFYAWFLISAGLCFAILAAGHLYMLIFLWGLSFIPLYILASGFEENRAAMGKKTLALFGGVHGLMATGAVMVVVLSGTGLLSGIELSTLTIIDKVAFLALLSGALVTIGIFPFQSWIIDFSEFAPGRISALMPVIIQRFAGLYLFIRLTHDLFMLSESIRVMLFFFFSITAILSVVISFYESHAGKRLAFLHIAAGGLALMAASTGTMAGLMASFVYLLASGAAIAALFLIIDKDLFHENGFSQKILNKKKRLSKNFFDSRGFLFLALAGLPPFGMFAGNVFLFKGLWELFDDASLAPVLMLLWLLTAVAAAGGLFAGTLLIRSHFQSNIHANKADSSSQNLNLTFGILLFTLLAMFSGLLLFITSLERIAQYFPAEAPGIWDIRHILLVAVSTLTTLLAGFGIFRLLQAKWHRLRLIPIHSETPGYTDIYHIVSKLVFSVNKPLSRMHDGVLQTYLVWVIAAMILLFLLN